MRHKYQRDGRSRQSDVGLSKMGTNVLASWQKPQPERSLRLLLALDHQMFERWLDKPTLSVIDAELKSEQRAQPTLDPVGEGGYHR
jgi:hypothetical protein